MPRVGLGILGWWASWEVRDAKSAAGQGIGFGCSWVTCCGLGDGAQIRVLKGQEPGFEVALGDAQWVRAILGGVVYLCAIRAGDIPDTGFEPCPSLLSELPVW